MKIMEITCNGYHSGIVRSELEFRQISSPAPLPAFFRDCRPQPAVRRYASAYCHLTDTGGFRRLYKLVHKYLYESPLKTCANIFLILLHEFRVQSQLVAHEIQKRSLYAAETVVITGNVRLGKMKSERVSLSGKPELAETILTSDLKNCDQAVLAGVTAIMDGTAPFGTQVVLTLKDKGVGLAENEYYLANMTEEELAVVEEAEEKIISGEIVVDDQLQDNTLFDSYIAKLN